MNSQRGSLALILCFGLAAFVGVVYFVYNSGSGTSSDAKDPQAMFTELQAQVTEAMANQAALSASVERNPNSFGCLYSVTADCKGHGGNFLLYGGEQPTAQALSQLPRNGGLNADGAGCRNFPSQQCPLRVEAQWTPICGTDRCEGTRGARVKVRVTLNDGISAPREWSREDMFNPSIRLSQAVVCERSGQVWAGTECLSPSEAAQRQLASRDGSNNMDRDHPRPGDDRDERAAEAEMAVTPQFTCPEEQIIQGVPYQLEHIGPARAQVRTPAINGCPAEDTFVFQCQEKKPADYEGEGVWVQVEAKTAPNCDEYGNPVGEGVNF